MNWKRECLLVLRLWLGALLVAVAIFGPTIYSDEQMRQYRLVRDLPRPYRPACQLVADELYCPGPTEDGWVAAQR